MIKKGSWQKALIAKSAKISDAIKSLNLSTMQVAIVVDSIGRLIGTVTDGDIRRAILEGKSLEDNIDAVMNTSPIFLQGYENKEVILDLMVAHKIQQIPEIDEKGKVIEIHIWSDLQSRQKLPNKFIIMAGGFGVRLLPLTSDTPKPMLEVGGKPMLEHIILKARSQGFSEFVISVGYRSDIIKNYFESGERFDVEIEYLEEDEPLGTAGSLSMLSTQPKKDLIVTNGDVLTEVNYLNLLNYNQVRKAGGTMAVRRIDIQNQFGVVELDGMNIVGFNEKPFTRSIINAGIYVITPDLLKLIPKNKKFDMPELFELGRLNGQNLIAFPLHEDWIDVGKIADYQKANLKFS